MKHRNLSLQFNEDDIRIEQIIHIATMCHDYAFPSEIEDAFDLEIDNLEEALGVKFHEEDDKEDISERLFVNDKLGFLVKAATPIPQRFTKNGYSTAGWGYYTTKWFYSETLDDIYEQVSEWKKHYITQERKRQHKGE